VEQALIARPVVETYKLPVEVPRTTGPAEVIPITQAYAEDGALAALDPDQDTTSDNSPPTTAQPTRRSAAHSAKITPGKPHSLKNHFRGCAREVIAYLDTLADLNPYRFAYCHVSTIVKKCHRYKGAGYSERAVKTCLKALQESGIIQRVTVNWHGDVKTGYIVAPHSRLTLVSPDAYCEFTTTFEINWFNGKTAPLTAPLT
jgi:hypothetical protein